MERILVDGKYGLLDDSGKKIVPCVYDYIGEFNDKIACVGRNNLFGYINKKGVEIVPCKYRAIGDFCGNIVRAYTDKEVFVDKTGKEIDSLEKFKNGEIKLKNIPNSYLLNPDFYKCLLKCAKDRVYKLANNCEDVVDKNDINSKLHEVEMKIHDKYLEVAKHGSKSSFYKVEI